MRMTDVDICNQALALAGCSDTIQSLTDTSVSARRCKQFFLTAIESVLRKHDWKSAEKVVELARNTEDPVMEFENSYAIPFDCVRVVQVYGDSSGYSPYDRWHISGRNILTDLDQCYLKYIAMPSDYRDLDILLAKTIAYEIAIMLAPALLKDKDQYALLFQSAQYVLREAKAMDTMESKEAKVESSRWQDERLSIGV